MSSSGFTYQDLMQVVELVEKSASFAEFHLKAGELEVHIQSRTHDAALAGERALPREAAPVLAALQASPAPAAAAESARPATPAAAAGVVIVKSPMVGTFYRAPEPGAAPFVDVGARVTPDTAVCIVEVMKLMNTLTAGASGVVVDIAVENGQPVEFGQVLVAIDTTR